MPTKNALMQYAHDVASHPTIVGTAATATTGVGFSTVFGWLEKGVGFAAALMGLMVTVALWRKLQMERREAELRIQVLEERLARGGSIDNHLDD